MSSVHLPLVVDLLGVLVLHVMVVAAVNSDPSMPQQLLPVRCKPGGGSCWSWSSSSSTAGALQSSGASTSSLNRVFTGVQPYNGSGFKNRQIYRIESLTNTIFTGTANRSPEWQALASQVSINVSAIRVWSDRPLPPDIQRFISNGAIAKPKNTNNLASEQVRILNHRVYQQGARREHVVEMSTVTGSCGVTASLSFTPDNTTFSILFTNFNAVTGTRNGLPVLQELVNCAFRVPITVPTGLTMAALTSQLRGFASSSPQGQAGIAWTASIGVGIDPAAWADVYTTDSYSARVWSGGASSGADFDPISIAMELDSNNPTFAPCSSQCRTCPKSFEVPVDFQFVLSAVRNVSETIGPRPVQSFIFLDSQDTAKKIGMNQPVDFETCTV